MKKFEDKLIDLLESLPKFVDEKTGNILRNEVVNSALKIDKELISLLIKDKEIREKFFTEISGYWVFEINKFVDYVQDKEFLDDTYTKFKNKIGLTIDNKFIGERGEVALSFPFKDCILEGGMTKEDEKRNEIFFNEVLAEDQINRLLDPKVLTNFKRYSTKGEERVTDFKRDKEGTIRENLIIKGNNLLALYSLKEQFQGKIKLIYIDPPYNIGKGDFGYNDRFNHSTWLTFMKNRLEVAKELLSKEGLIFISISQEELCHLKVMCDEIFENFVTIISVESPSYVETTDIVKMNEFLLVYKKDMNYSLFGDIKRTESRGTVGNENQTISAIEFPVGLRVEGVKDGIYKDTRKLGGNEDINLISKEIIIENGKLKDPIILKARWRNPNDMKKFFENKCKPIINKFKKKIVEVYIKGDRFMPYTVKESGEKLSSLLVSKNIEGINAKGSKELNEIMPDFDFSHPKHTNLIRYVLKFTNEGDIILDFFAGSATTAQAILDISNEEQEPRQFIIIEQMDYVSKSTNRVLKAILKNEKDNFIFCELMKFNKEAMEKIREANDTTTLLDLWKEICEKYFLNYSIEVKKFNDNVEEFKELQIGVQKKVLIEMLNKNQLYVNLSEINDSDFKVSKEDKELNKKFYSD